MIAGRAAALEREGARVLVIAFNHTLLNWMRDLASRFGGKSQDITWLNFHYWCKRTMYEAGCEAEYKQLWSQGQGDSPDELDAVLETRLAEAVGTALEGGPLRSAVAKYDAILVDEGQDMTPEWWRLLRGVLEEGGEMVLVADWAQDVYSRQGSWTDVAMHGAGFPGGRWAELDTSYRLPPELVALTQRFCDEFLAIEPQFRPVPVQQLELKTEPVLLRWVQADEDGLIDATVAEVLALPRVSDENTTPPLSWADITIVVDSLERGRAICAHLEHRRVHVLHTFDADKQARRRQKQTFYKGSEKLKATTILSFKGWESRALVLCLGPGTAHEMSLWYTALTRLRRSTNGSYLTVICAVADLARYGASWPSYQPLLDAPGTRPASEPVARR